MDCIKGIVDNSVMYTLF